MTEPCPSCGTRDEEWRDPKTKRPHDPPPYVAEGRRCIGCAERTREAESLVDSRTGRLEPGVTVHLRRWNTELDEADLPD